MDLSFSHLPESSEEFRERKLSWEEALAFREMGRGASTRGSCLLSQEGRPLSWTWLPSIDTSMALGTVCPTWGGDFRGSLRSSLRLEWGRWTWVGLGPLLQQEAPVFWSSHFPILCQPLSAHRALNLGKRPLRRDCLLQNSLGKGASSKVRVLADCPPPPSGPGSHSLKEQL